MNKHALGWVVGALVVWQLLKSPIFPSPLEVVLAIPSLWSDGAVSELMTSLWANVEAICLSALIGLPLAYMSRIPAMNPIVTFVGKLRFPGSAVFYLPLLLVAPTLHWVKLSLLALGEMFYLVTSMSGVVTSIPQYRFDDAYTLRMGKWQTLWYVVIRGTVPEALTAIKENAAVGWSMILFVEGIIRSEGGIGLFLFAAEKYTNYDQFFAIVFLIVAVGIGQDWLLRQTRTLVCPYAEDHA